MLFQCWILPGLCKHGGPNRHARFTILMWFQISNVWETWTIHLTRSSDAFLISSYFCCSKLSVFSEFIGKTLALCCRSMKWVPTVPPLTLATAPVVGLNFSIADDAKHKKQEAYGSAIPFHENWPLNLPHQKLKPLEQCSKPLLVDDYRGLYYECPPFRTPQHHRSPHRMAHRHQKVTPQNPKVTPQDANPTGTPCSNKNWLR